MNKARWTAPKPFDSNLLAKTACYLYAKPSFHISLAMRRELSSSYDNAVKHACRRLALMGYVQVAVGHITGTRWDDDPAVSFTNIPADLRNEQLVMAYAGTDKLRDDYLSGELERVLVTAKKQRTAVPVNERIIQVLASRHPDAMTVEDLKALTEVSESHPALVLRLEHLATTGWTIVTPFSRAASNYNDERARWYTAQWTVKLGDSGWLWVRRAEQDGTKLKVPKPKKKPNTRIKKAVNV